MRTDLRGQGPGMANQQDTMPESCLIRWLLWGLLFSMVAMVSAVEPLKGVTLSVECQGSPRMF